MSVTFGSFENFFQKLFFSSFYKEVFDVALSLILERRILSNGMACAIIESVENFFFFLRSSVIF